MNTDVLIQAKNGEFFVGSSRVLLQNIVSARQQGQTPEEIEDNFPSLSLAEVYGALVYYFEHRDMLDAHFAENERLLEEAHAANYAAHADFFDAMHTRFEATRQHKSSGKEQSPGA